MIFNVMENKEELLFALKELREGEVSEISSNLEQYIMHVSKTGETMFAWQLIQPLLSQKLRRVSDDFYTEMPTDQLPSRPNTEHVQFHELQNRVLEHISRFSGTPFTIQRLCELLVNPRSHYTRPDKFLRGIEKIVMVVSTVEAMKVANGSVASACSDDEVSEAEKSSGPGLNGVWCGPPSPSSKLSPNRPASPALDLTDRPDRPGPLSPTHPLSTGPKLPDADLPVAALRPMGQLEAFVQNVSQRLSSPICPPSNGKEEVPSSRLASLLPEDGESRKREVPSSEARESTQDEDEGDERPAKVPRLVGWKEKESEEQKGEEDRGESMTKSCEEETEKSSMETTAEVEGEKSPEKDDEEESGEKSVEVESEKIDATSPEPAEASETESAEKSPNEPSEKTTKDPVVASGNVSPEGPKAEAPEEAPSRDESPLAATPETPEKAATPESPARKETGSPETASEDSPN